MKESLEHHYEDIFMSIKQFGLHIPENIDIYPFKACDSTQKRKKN